jgi:type VI secretion system protein ImpG
MRMEDNLYKAFLEEMNELDNFRAVYASLHPGISLEREDPDVRRLTEAMAFFSARTRLAGMQNISSVILRFFRQFFPFMLTHLPSMAIIQATPTRKLAESILFARGAELNVVTESGRTAIFRVMNDLNVLPISQQRFSVLLLPEKGMRMVMAFGASYSRNENIGTLSFFINYLNNYDHSALLFYHLKRCLKGVSVVFNEQADEFSQGQVCEFSFSPSRMEGEDEHPLEKERIFFHFPWLDLYMHIQIPEPPSGWRNFSLCFDMDSGWPKNLTLNPDMFRLFTVPVINIRKDAAQPLLCNATEEKYPIRHPRLHYDFLLHSVKGIYEITKEGLVFVKPGILSGAAPSYETEESTDSRGRISTNLLLHYPAAFNSTRTLTVDALWYQPWFSEAMTEKMTLLPFSHVSAGIQWDFMVKPVPHREDNFQKNTETFLRFLTLTHKEVLNIDDLMDILQIMGVMHNPKYALVCNLISGVRVEKAPSREPNAASLLKYRYILRFKEFSASQEPLVEILVRHIQKILSYWLSSAVLEVRIEKVSSEQNSQMAG